MEKLEEELDPHLQIYECKVFMHGGASFYRSKVFSEFLRKLKIKVLEWSRNSLDLNPIENLWDILKNKVGDKQPSSAEHLWKIIKEPWVKDLPVNTVQL